METMLMKVTQDMKALENRTTRTDLGGGEGQGGRSTPFFLYFESVFVTNNTKSV